ncbi:hypothetical protein MVES1_001944 [Malassezia vespertilionis]|uniref:uncharacterized protein n=1 Tax=Malassezia vespertilionis TaxID=2020962 RepID=UPI0024B0504C|nr:uncharacterized protein MVES1_001944 [Malassezia vespertilionis]WFD06591.1 hypothetical protein MVES1_001944 [Malassezia vespertilionis]
MDRQAELDLALINSEALFCLRREQLLNLCKRRGIKAKGKTEQLIDALRQSISTAHQQDQSPSAESTSPTLTQRSVKREETTPELAQESLSVLSPVPGLYQARAPKCQLDTGSEKELFMHALSPNEEPADVSTRSIQMAEAGGEKRIHAPAHGTTQQHEPSTTQSAAIEELSAGAHSPRTKPHATKPTEAVTAELNDKRHRVVMLCQGSETKSVDSKDATLDRVFRPIPLRDDAMEAYYYNVCHAQQSKPLTHGDMRRIYADLLTEREKANAHKLPKRVGRMMRKMRSLFDASSDVQSGEPAPVKAEAVLDTARSAEPGFYNVADKSMMRIAMCATELEDARALPVPAMNLASDYSRHEEVQASQRGLPKRSLQSLTPSSSANANGVLSATPRFARHDKPGQENRRTADALGQEAENYSPLPLSTKSPAKSLRSARHSFAQGGCSQQATPSPKRRSHPYGALTARNRLRPTSPGRALR